MNLAAISAKLSADELQEAIEACDRCLKEPYTPKTIEFLQRVRAMHAANLEKLCEFTT